MCKHMKILHVSMKQIKMEMSTGFLDMLTTIPIDEIVEQGVPRVKIVIESSGISKEDVVNGTNFGNDSIDSGVNMHHS